MTHLNELSKVYLDKISEALTPEQRAAAQQILDKETGGDKKKEEMKAKKKRSEIRKDKELELKQANLKIRQDREARRKEDRDDRKQDKVAREKADALKAKQKDLAKNVSDKTKAAAGASKAAQASLASAKPKETITDKDGDGTALGKLGANAARGVAGVAGATINTVKSMRLRQQAKKGQAALDKTKVQEDTLLEVDEVDSKDKKADKVIDVMRGKNKVEVNPKLKAEDYHAGQGEKIAARTRKWMKKKGQDGAPGLDAMKARTAEHKAKRGVKEEVGCETKKIENKGKKKIDPKKNPVVEAKVDKGRSDYGKATIRNWRHSGPDTVEPAMFDPDNKRGKTIEKRREEHKARRGKKGAKVPTYNKEDVTIQDAKGRDFLEIIDIVKPEPMKSPKNTVQWTEEKIAKLMKKANEKKRKNALQINKIVGTQ